MWDSDSLLSVSPMQKMLKGASKDLRHSNGFADARVRGHVRDRVRRVLGGGFGGSVPNLPLAPSPISEPYLNFKLATSVLSSG